MAAHARGSLRLAGELADGVVIGTGTTPEVVEASLNALAEGARIAGRDPNDIDVWWSVPFNLHDSDNDGLDPQGGPAREANYLNRFTLKGKFVPRQYWQGIRALAQAYDLSTHGRPTPEQLRRYDALAEEYGVRDYLLERFGGISGTAEAMHRQAPPQRRHRRPPIQHQRPRRKPPPTPPPHDGRSHQPRLTRPMPKPPTPLYNIGGTIQRPAEMVK